MRIALVFITSLILCSACTKSDGGRCLTRTGQQVSIQFELDSFSLLEIRGNYTVFYQVQNQRPYKVRMEGGEHLLEGLKPRVQGFRCQLVDQNRCHWLRSYKQENYVFISGPPIDSLLYEASGSLRFEDKTQGSNVQRPFYFISYQANGQVSLDIDRDSVFIKQRTGPADVWLYGNQQFVYLYNSTEGKSNTLQANTRFTHIIHHGYNLCTISAIDSGRIEIYNRGSVNFPASVPYSLMAKGSGQLILR